MRAWIDHTADVVLSARGHSLESLYTESLRALTTLLKPGACVGNQRIDCCHDVELRAPDRVALLVEFLSECLTLTYLQHTLWCHAHFHFLSRTHLQARLFGQWTASFENDIKAVTYHEAEVRMASDGAWEAHLICDI